MLIYAIINYALAFIILALGPQPLRDAAIMWVIFAPPALMVLNAKWLIALYDKLHK